MRGPSPTGAHHPYRAIHASTVRLASRRLDESDVLAATIAVVEVTGDEPTLRELLPDGRFAEIRVIWPKREDDRRRKVRRCRDAGVAMPSERSADSNRSSQRAEARDLVVVTKLSPWSMADTVARLSAVVAARGMKVFAVIDHSDEARRVGLALRDTKVVWEDGYHTKVSYPSPAEVARRSGLDGDLAAALASIDALTSTVIDR
jgi:hypothetical protein